MQQGLKRVMTTVKGPNPQAIATVHAWGKHWEHGESEKKKEGLDEREISMEANSE